jgi:hypothetical protein
MLQGGKHTLQRLADRLDLRQVHGPCCPFQTMGFPKDGFDDVQPLVRDRGALERNEAGGHGADVLACFNLEGRAQSFQEVMVLCAHEGL